jgi:hypothetical protein
MDPSRDDTLHCRCVFHGVAALHYDAGGGCCAALLRRFIGGGRPSNRLLLVGRALAPTRDGASHCCHAVALTGVGTLSQRRRLLGGEPVYQQRHDGAHRRPAQCGGQRGGGVGRTCTTVFRQSPPPQCKHCATWRGGWAARQGGRRDLHPRVPLNHLPRRQAPRHQAAPSLVPLVVRGPKDHRGGATGCGHRPQLRAAQVMPRNTLRFPGRRLGVPRPWGSCGTISARPYT